METREWTREARTIASDFTVREDGQVREITGYFSVFNSNYDIGPGMSESIAPGAFAETISGDIRALTNHDTTLVLGRTKAGTLELSEDSRGLKGTIAINPNDRDAVNLWERVKRGDVDQCSFGFDILDEEAEYREDGSVHWTIKSVKLYEVSVCTFPAYQETSVQARAAQRTEMQHRKMEVWKDAQKARINNGIKSTDAPQENRHAEG